MCIATDMQVHLHKCCQLGDYVDLWTFYSLLSILFLKSGYRPSGKWRDRLYIKIYCNLFQCMLLFCQQCYKMFAAAASRHDMWGRQEDSAEVGVFVSL